MSTKDTLQAKAMLISLSISYWGGKVKDERVVDEIVKKHKGDKDMHDYKKLIVDPKYINEPKAIRSRARAYFFDRTSPWLDGGTRVLAQPLYFEVAEKMREFKAEYEAATRKIVRQLSVMKGEARKRLGNLFREEDYPSEAALERKFGWDMKVLPIPDAGDWRVDLGGKENASVRKQIEEQLTSAAKIIADDNWKRLYDVVESLSVKLKTSDAMFRDSIIGNIKDVCKVMHAMNITGDAQITAMTKRIEAELSKFVPDELREDPKARKKARDAADAILDKMSAYIGAK